MNHLLREIRQSLKELDGGLKVRWNEWRSRSVRCSSLGRTGHIDRDRTLARMLVSRAGAHSLGQSSLSFALSTGIVVPRPAQSAPRDRELDGGFSTTEIRLVRRPFQSTIVSHVDHASRGEKTRLAARSNVSHSRSDQEAEGRTTNGTQGWCLHSQVRRPFLHRVQCHLACLASSSTAHVGTDRRICWRKQNSKSCVHPCR